MRTAFDCRLRLVDTASFYEIEREVGRAVREAVRSGIRREDIFVQTKLNPSQYGDPERALKEGMMRLGLDYVDTAILHHPGANDLAAYRAKERAVERGLARPIGLSNGYVDELTTFLPGSARVRRSFKTKFIPSIGKGTSFLLFGRKGSPCRVGIRSAGGDGRRRSSRIRRSRGSRSASAERPHRSCFVGTLNGASP